MDVVRAEESGACNIYWIRFICTRAPEARADRASGDTFGQISAPFYSILATLLPRITQQLVLQSGISRQFIQSAFLAVEMKHCALKNSVKFLCAILMRTSGGTFTSGCTTQYSSTPLHYLHCAYKTREMHREKQRGMRNAHCFTIFRFQATLTWHMWIFIWKIER